MPSGKRAKQQRREAAASGKTPPPVRSKGAAGGGARQASPRALAIAGGILVIVIVAIVLAVVLGKSGNSGSSNGSGDGPTLSLASGTPAVGNSKNTVLQAATEVAALYKGIPENHFILGNPNAPVTLTEFIDLQCPDCQIFETQDMPTLVKTYVRTGKLKVKMMPWNILDRTPDVHDSLRGQKATIAAAAQNKAFQFAELLYFNQGTEDTNWMNDRVISQIAAGVDGLKPAQLINDANSSATASLIKQIDSEANSLVQKNQNNGVDGSGFVGTPGLFLSKGNGAPQFYESAVPNLGQLEHAIDALLK